MTKVINMYGGPGTGKTTSMAGLFSLMKLKAMSVELVTEFAKDLVWGERHNMFTEQDFIFAEQNHRLRRLVGKVDWIITDSPLLLSHIYMPDDYPGKEPFLQFVDEMYDSYDNINILLTRVKEYDANGRNQTEDEARAIDDTIHALLQYNNHRFQRIIADHTAAQAIYDHITTEDLPF